VRYRVTDARAYSQENTVLAVLLDAASTLVTAASSDCERLHEPLPSLGTAGWILFPPISQPALQRFSTLARLDEDRLRHIQTPSAWLFNWRCVPYCFRCLVLNDADVSVPRWKREWLDPTAEFCSVHHTILETVPASVFRLSGHFAAALRAISRYREKQVFKDRRRLR
jgi:hypothetical protein